MPRGGSRKGAGRPLGSGRYAEQAKSMRVPNSLVGHVSEMLATHAREVSASKKLARAKKGASKKLKLEVPEPGSVSIVGPIEALPMLSSLAEQGIQAAAVILDPMYRAKKEAGRAAYLSEMIALIDAASRVAPHVFVWGFPESIARLVDHWPAILKLEAWLTWYFKNAPSRAKSWRPSQQACLHLRRKDGRMYPEHFYSDRHRKLAAKNRLEFKPTPYSVLEEALLSGFIKRSEQTGFRMQKPESVIEPLLKMSTKPGDLVIDPTAGSGTTAAVAVRLGRSAIISDRSGAALRICRKRLRD